MHEIGRRFPQRHRVAIPDRAEQRVGRQVLAHLVRGEAKPRLHLGQHRVAVVARGDALAAAHDAAQGPFDGLLFGHDIAAVADGCALERGTEPGQTPAQRLDMRRVVSEQKAGRGQKILVVIFLLDLGIGGVRLVRRRREQQGTHRLALRRLRPDQGLKERGGRVAPVGTCLQQSVEALEFVQDHQVRLEGADAGARQVRAQLADQAVAPGAQLRRQLLAVAPETGLRQLAQLVVERRVGAQPCAEVLGNVRVGRPRVVVQAPAPALGVRDVALQQIHQARTRGVNRLQQRKQHLPLRAGAGGVAHRERGAGCETDEVELGLAQARPTVERCQLSRQHGQACRQLGAVLAVRTDAQLGQIRPGDALIAADIDDIDALDRLPKMRDGACDDTACNQGFAEPDLVGHQKAGAAVRREKQAIEGMLDGAALKRLERRQHRVDVRLGHTRLRGDSAVWTACQSNHRSSGTSWRPSSVRRRSSSSCRTGSRRDGSRDAARTRSSSSAGSAVAVSRRAAGAAAASVCAQSTRPSSPPSNARRNCNSRSGLSISVRRICRRRPSGRPSAGSFSVRRRSAPGNSGARRRKAKKPVRRLPGRRQCNVAGSASA
jgi:hypothetical protein